MAEFVGKPSKNARPGGKRQFIKRGEEVKSSLEKAWTSPTSDARTETGMIPVDATERDKPVKQGKESHQPFNIGNIVGTQRIFQAQVRFPVTEAMFNFHAAAVKGKGKFWVSE